MMRWTVVTFIVIYWLLVAKHDSQAMSISTATPYSTNTPPYTTTTHTTTASTTTAPTFHTTPPHCFYNYRMLFVGESYGGCAGAFCYPAGQVTEWDYCGCFHPQAGEDNVVPPGTIVTDSTGCTGIICEKDFIHLNRWTSWNNCTTTTTEVVTTTPDITPSTTTPLTTTTTLRPLYQYHGQTLDIGESKLLGGDDSWCFGIAKTEYGIVLWDKFDCYTTTPATRNTTPDTTTDKTNKTKKKLMKEKLKEKMKQRLRNLMKMKADKKITRNEYLMMKRKMKNRIKKKLTQKIEKIKRKQKKKKKNNKKKYKMKNNNAI